MPRWRLVVVWNSVMTSFLILSLFVTSAFATGDQPELELRRSKRVIGGAAITQGQWPNLVSLHGHIPTSRFWVFVTSYADYACGGSLIAPRWVLTAAHCFKSFQIIKDLDSPRKWRVKAGDTDRRPGSLLNVIKSALGADVSGDSGRWWYVRVSKIIVYPAYEPADTFSWRNDLALVKLSRALPMAPDNPNIDVATLPTKMNISWPPPGTNCTMIGWGCTNKDGPLEDIAHGLSVPILSNSECFNDYGDLGDDRICAGYFNSNKGVCKGDSGGPLVCQDGATWKQAGIVSYTSSSSPDNRPSVFTRVTKFLPWINSTISTH